MKYHTSPHISLHITSLQYFFRIIFSLCSVVIVGIIGAPHQSNGQGCSDAGLCSIEGVQPKHFDSVEPKNQLSFGMIYGSADNQISTIGSFVEYRRQLSHQIRVEVKLTALSQSGNGISVANLSDIYLTMSSVVTPDMKIIAGGKVPLTNGNSMVNNRPLPMDYQSSLGTLDMIVGISYDFHPVQLVFAFQQPLTQNSNTFVPEQEPSHSPLRTFQATRNFRRAADMLVRVSCPLPLSNTLTLTPSILPIYHLSNDTFRTPTDGERSITGSQGLTLNANLFASYSFSTNSILVCSIGTPLLVRKIRPDGLTRGIVLSLEFTQAF